MLSSLSHVIYGSAGIRTRVLPQTTRDDSPLHHTALYNSKPLVFCCIILNKAHHTSQTRFSPPSPHQNTLFTKTTHKQLKHIYESWYDPKKELTPEQEQSLLELFEKHGFNKDWTDMKKKSGTSGRMYITCDDMDLFFFLFYSSLSLSCIVEKRVG